ncbi:MAG: 50S ribosomal protein L31 [Alphaproteobacteria bacterium CG11_big_fil_rev_8_21_14_0_20_44_7]|nr:MAG: 50S ribosomal protein L31 [Alphaproteobacteria bacterium CG11_big_fil_rev_8_21_14_0_20_44_7]
MTDGTEYETRSTWGKEGDTMRLDVDPKTHPAWNKGGHHIIETAGQIDKFKKRYGNFGIGKKPAAAEAKPAEDSSSEEKPAE